MEAMDFITYGIANMEGMDFITYGSAIGSLMYTMVCTRSSFSQLVKPFSAFIANHGHEH